MTSYYLLREKLGCGACLLDNILICANGMEINVDKTKVMRFPRQPFGLLDPIIYMKLNLVFPWQKQDSATKRFMPASWT